MGIAEETAESGLKVNEMKILACNCQVHDNKNEIITR